MGSLAHALECCPGIVTGAFDSKIRYTNRNITRNLPTLRKSPRQRPKGLLFPMGELPGKGVEFLLRNYLSFTTVK